MDPLVEIQEIESFLDEFMSKLEYVLQQMANNGEELSDDVAGMLVDELEITINRLNELKALDQERQQELQRQQDSQIEPNLYDNASLLWILAGGNSDAFVSYLNTFNDPALSNLLRNPSLLNSFINRLSQQFPQGIDLSADGIDHAPFMSSNVYGFKYNPQSGKLRVRFNSGSVYEYSNVPKQIFNLFKNGAIPAKTNGRNKWGEWWQGKVPSLGASFYELIKLRGYPYRRLN